MKSWFQTMKLMVCKPYSWYTWYNCMYSGIILLLAQTAWKFYMRNDVVIHVIWRPHPQSGICVRSGILSVIVTIRKRAAPHLHHLLCRRLLSWPKLTSLPASFISLIACANNNIIPLRIKLYAYNEYGLQTMSLQLFMV
jgi:hypothetical protein